MKPWSKENRLPFTGPKGMALDSGRLGLMKSQLWGRQLLDVASVFLDMYSAVRGQDKKPAQVVQRKNIRRLQRIEVNDTFEFDDVVCDN